MKTVVIVPAGGIGKRFGGDLPKQFTDLKGTPIIIHTLRIFQNTPEVDSIVIPVHSDHFARMKKLMEEYDDISKVKEIVIGGSKRQESVINALHTKEASDADIILVHDAVRPLTSIALVQKVISETEEIGAVIPGIRPNDTLKEISGAGSIVKTIDRARICLVQTPQGYWQELINNAYKSASEAGFEGTDSSSLVEFIGYKVQVIDGEQSNMKITTKLDLKVAEMLLDKKD